MKLLSVFCSITAHSTPLDEHCRHRGIDKLCMLADAGAYQRAECVNDVQVKSLEDESQKVGHS
eukprot:21231-Heterococcus_DN1.PRE.16